MMQHVISYDEASQDFLQNGRPLQNLSPLEQSVLHFFLENPSERHTKDAIIENAWPDEVVMGGITDDSLYAIIASLRRKIEPAGVKAAHIITWRGQGQSGYRFFPAVDVGNGDP